MALDTSCCSRGALQRRLPILAWLPDYSLQWLRMDFIAGLSVGLTVIPQALAYAEVAGLPPQYGLYSAFMGCFVYCFLGTSRDVTLGPTAIMSLLVSVYTFHEPAYAILLTFLSGCIQLAMGFLHLGFLLDFISCPVIKGFTSAATITIGFGQIKNLLGLQNIPRQFFLQVYHIFLHIRETRVGDTVLGLACMVLLLVLKLMRARVPPPHPEMPLVVKFSCGVVWTVTTARNALVVSFAALIAYSFEVTGHHPFLLTGKIVEGLPPVRVPPFSVTTDNKTISFSEMVQDMGAGIAVIPLVGLLESIAVAKSFASQNNYRIDANQELLAIGLANVLGSFVSSYPITGSFGRTAVNAQTGVCTPAGGLVTGVLVLLSLNYLTSLFYYIPKAALAAVIIMAVAPLFDAKILRTLWHIKRLDLLPLCMTFLLCFWEVQYGILAGTLVSMLILLHSVARPKTQVLEGHILVLQPASGLHFPAIDALREAIMNRALEASLPRCTVLDCTHVSSIDYTVVVGLGELLEDFQKRGVALAFTGLQVPVLRILLAADLKGFQYFSTLEEAEREAREESGGQSFTCKSLELSGAPVQDSENSNAFLVASTSEGKTEHGEELKEEFPGSRKELENPEEPESDASWTIQMSKNERRRRKRRRRRKKDQTTTPFSEAHSFLSTSGPSSLDMLSSPGSQDSALPQNQAQQDVVGSQPDQSLDTVNMPVEEDGSVHAEGSSIPLQGHTVKGTDSDIGSAQENPVPSNHTDIKDLNTSMPSVDKGLLQEGDCGPALSAYRGLPEVSGASQRAPLPESKRKKYEHKQEMPVTAELAVSELLTWWLTLFPTDAKATGPNPVERDEKETRDRAQPSSPVSPATSKHQHQEAELPGKPANTGRQTGEVGNIRPGDQRKPEENRNCASALRDKKEQKNQKVPRATEKYSETLNPEDGVTVYFHAILSRHFAFDPENHRVCVRGGEGLGTAGWTEDACEMHYTKDLQDLGALIEGRMVIPRQSLNKHIPYKYVIHRSASSKDTTEYEFIYERPQRGEHVNRCLLVNSALLGTGGWHQYDDIICKKPSGKLQKFMDIFTDGTRRDLVKGKNHAAVIMLDRIFSVLQPWSDINLHSFMTQFQQFYSVVREPKIHEVQARPWSSLQSDEREVRRNLWEHVRKQMKGSLQRKSEDCLPADCPVRSRLQLGLTILFMVEAVDFDVSKNDLVSLCDLLIPSSASLEALHSDMSPTLSKSQKWRAYLVNLCRRGMDKSIEHWLGTLPVLHCCMQPSPPRKDSKSQSEDTWAGLEGICFAQFRDTASTSKVTDCNQVLQFMQRSMALLEVDEYLFRSWFSSVPLESLTSYLENSTEYLSHDPTRVLDCFQGISYRLQGLKKISNHNIEGTERLLKKMIHLVDIYEDTILGETLLQTYLSECLTLHETVCNITADRKFYEIPALSAELLCKILMLRPAGPSGSHGPTAGPGAKDNEDLQTFILQEVLNTTRTWLRGMFKGSMFRSSSAIAQFTYSEEMALWRRLVDIAFPGRFGWKRSLLGDMEGRIKQEHPHLQITVFCSSEWNDGGLHDSVFRSFEKCVVEAVSSVCQSQTSVLEGLSCRDLRRLGTLLSAVITKSWPRHNGEAVSDMDEIFRYLLTWPDVKELFKLCGTHEKIIDHITEEGRQLMAKAESVFQKVAEELENGTIVIGQLELIFQHRSQFAEIWNQNRIRLPLQKKACDLNSLLATRLDALRFLKQEKRYVETLLRQFGRVKDLVQVDFGNIEAIHSQDLSNKRLSEALIELPDSSPPKRKTHYNLSPEIREIASKLDSLKDSHIFQVLWRKTAKSTLNQDHRGFLLPEACSCLYHPCYDKFYKLYENLKSGEITFAEVDDIFRDFADNYDEMTVDLKFMCTLDPQDRKGWISERVGQIKEYHSLHQAVSSARVILQVRSTLGVTGDFSVLDTLLNFLNDSAEELYIRQIVQRLVDSIAVEERDASVIADVLSASQEFMRKKENECGFVSLRDVERCMKVFRWFYDHSEMLLNKLDDFLHQSSDKQHYFERDPVLWSLVMATGVCYHASLEDKASYRTAIGRCFPEPYNDSKCLEENSDLKTHGPFVAVMTMLCDCKDKVSRTLSRFGIQACHICLGDAQDPVCLPCDHVYCLPCIKTWLVPGHMLCPYCLTEFSDKFSLTVSQEHRKAIEKHAQFRHMCNSFFVDLVSTMCFKDDSPPQGRVIDSLLSLLFIQKESVRDASQKHREHTKSLSPFGDVVDKTPVIRSVVLKLLLKYSFHEVKDYIQNYLTQLENKAFPTEDKTELYLLFINCLEDSVHEKTSAGCGSNKQGLREECHFLTTYSPGRQGQEPASTASVDYLQEVARVQLCLDMAADFLSELQEGSELAEDKHCFLKHVKQFCMRVQNDWHRVYLVRKLSSQRGMEFVQSFSRQGHPCQWIFPRHVIAQQKDNRSQLDRYLVHGDEYKALRDAVGKAVLECRTLDIGTALMACRSPRAQQTAYLLLALHREVASLYRSHNASLHPKPEQCEAMKKFIEESEILSAPKIGCFAKSLVDDSLPLLRTRSPNSSLGQTVTEMAIHAAVILLCGQNYVLEPLRNLAFDPANMANAFLPTMPEDLLVKARNWKGLEGVHWYYCPNGHPCSVGECGRPMEESFCLDCRAKIGGLNHNPHQGFHPVSDNKDRTQTGHVLGDPQSSGLVTASDRGLSPVVFILTQLLTHLAMLVGATQNPQALICIIKPRVQNPQSFLQLHIQRNLEQLTKMLGKSADETTHVVHLILCSLLKERHPKSGQRMIDFNADLSTKGCRNNWEKHLEALLLPELEHLDKTLPAVNALIRQDERISSNPVAKILYGDPATFLAHLPKSVIYCSKIWSCRKKITVENLQHIVEQKNGKETVPVLWLFLQKEAELRLVKFLPEILALQRDLVNRFQNDSEAEYRSIRGFISSHQSDGLRKRLHDQITVFLSTWNALRRSLKTNGKIKLPQDYCSSDLDLDAEFEVLLPWRRDLGLCATVLVSYLINLHNQMVYAVQEFSGENNSYSVDTSEVTDLHVISYEVEQDLNPLILSNCQYQVQQGGETSQEFDLEKIQRQISSRFLQGKPKLTLMENPYWNYEKLFMKIKNKMAQSPLTKSAISAISGQLQSYSDTCEALSIIEVTLRFLSTGGGDPDMDLNVYVQDILQMGDQTALILKALHRCQLRHVIALWQFLSAHKSEQRLRLKKELFWEIDVKYKEDLSPQHTRLLHTFLNEAGLDAFLLELHEMIVLKLKGPQAESSFNPNWSLKDTLVSYMETKESDVLPEVESQFPEEILMCSCISVWKAAATRKQGRQSR
ncbi:E3 ubiquitin-protein ligase RNF213 isoform X1 [Sigmodon hispidus]